MKRQKYLLTCICGTARVAVLQAMVARAFLLKVTSKENLYEQRICEMMDKKPVSFSFRAQGQEGKESGEQWV